MGEERPPGWHVQFRVDEVKLQAVAEPCAEGAPLQVSTVMEALAEQGYSDWFIREGAVSDLVKQCRGGTEPTAVDIGERRDGECSITLAADKMTAWLSLVPPYGGKPVDREQAERLLQEKAISSGILGREIDVALAAGAAQDKIIARGREPVPGSDARFESLLPELKERRPHVDEHGVADYRDLGQINIVHPDQPLMRRVPAVTGKSGENVLGEAVPPPVVQDHKFAPGLQGAKSDPGDANVLLAAITGQPVLVTHGVTVEPAITLASVDLASGNLNFEGTVNVHGDVKESMKISATGDVIVGGMVEAAEIEAGGDVVVKGGIIGHIASGNAPHGAHGATASIRSKGSVSARFIENAEVRTGNSILLEDHASHSDLTALNEVMIGKKGSKKGHILGGTTRATALVKALVIGSAGGVATVIHVGHNPYLQEQLEEARLELHNKKKEQENLYKVIAYLKENPDKNRGGLLEKAERTLEKLLTDIIRLSETQQDLLGRMKFAEDAKVVVEGAIHSGVEIRIGNRIWRVADERAGGTCWLKDGEIFFTGT